MEPCLAGAVLAVIDILLVAWCYNNISIREASRYSGYSIWYKFLKA